MCRRRDTRGYRRDIGGGSGSVSLLTDLTHGFDQCVPSSEVSQKRFKEKQDKQEHSHEKFIYEGAAAGKF